MIRKSLLCLCLSAVFTVSAIVPVRSQAPAPAKMTNGFKVDAVGPSFVPTGEIAHITVGDSTSKKYAFTVIPSHKDFFVDTGGKDAYLAGREGMTFTVVVVGIDGENVAIDTQTTVFGPPRKPDAPGPVPPGPNVPPVVTPPVVPPDSKALAATFVYEKDEHVVPAAVLSGLNKLNRERKIIATLLDDDTTDGGGNIPEQYQLIIPAARTAGLPALIVTGAKGVLAVVKNPKTEDDVLKAVP